MTQIQPPRMMVHLRPRLSASQVTARAPAKEPAGMEATIPPCLLELG